jgi:hypothetical protein
MQPPALRVFWTRSGATVALVAAFLAVHSKVFDLERPALALAVQQQSRAGIITTANAKTDTPVMLWADPVDLNNRNLFYGPGGMVHEPPAGDFTFLKEDLEGSKPKYDVIDTNGVTWRIKLGTEARPETAATRLVWAAGYVADEDYFVGKIHVVGMPAHPHRGSHLIENDGTIPNARLERIVTDRRKLGTWSWRDNPFSGTREFNGLRVLMAVINNWDLKDTNNSVFELKHGDHHERIFEVSDLGLSFGTTGLERTQQSNGDLRTYRRTRFITDMSDTDVSFEVPRRPDWIVLANVSQFFSRLKLRWIGRHIPRADARWMGERLAQISPDQMRDAFRAAGYSADDVEGFVAVIENRIRQLNEL